MGSVAVDSVGSVAVDSVDSVAVGSVVVDSVGSEQSQRNNPNLFCHYPNTLGRARIRRV